MSASTLQGLSLILTRPEGQSTPLKTRLEEDGARVVLVPTIKIVARVPRCKESELLPRLSEYNLVIFISANAAAYACAYLRQQRLTWPASLRVAAVGEATRRALIAQDIPVVLVPATRYDTEALLEMPSLTQVNGQSILVVRGVGGRELLAQTLRARGAQVDYWETYQRQRPDPDEFRTALARSMPTDLVICTSVEGIQNLVDLAAEYRTPLLATPLLVVGQRQQHAARTLGFISAVFKAERASDEALWSAVVAWRS